jgi:hypothetical protein
VNPRGDAQPGVQGKRNQEHVGEFFSFFGIFSLSWVYPSLYNTYVQCMTTECTFKCTLLGGGRATSIGGKRYGNATTRYQCGQLVRSRRLARDVDAFLEGTRRNERRKKVAAYNMCLSVCYSGTHLGTCSSYCTFLSLKLRCSEHL